MKSVDEARIELKNIRALYAQEVDKLGRLGYISIALFGVPAIGVVMVGNMLVDRGIAPSSAYGLLALCALLFSSCIFYMLFKKVQKNILSLEERIHALAQIVEPSDTHD